MHAVILRSHQSIQNALRATSILFIAAVAIVLLVLQPFPVLHDYPEWMYQGYIAHSLLTNNADISRIFELVYVPVPNAISQVAIAGLNSITTPVVAGKVWLLFYLLLAAVVAVLATRSHQRGGAMQMIVTSLVLFGPGFWNGYINFQYGLLFLTLFVITNARLSLLGILVFSVLIYFSHASVFAGFVCYVIATEYFTKRRLSPLLVLVPSLILLFWYTAKRLLVEGDLNTGVGSLSQWAQYKIYTLAKQGGFHNFIRPDGESLLANLHGLYMAGFVLNFVIALLIGSWIIITLYWYVRRRDISLPVKANVHAAAFTVLVLLVLWLLAGKNSFGVVNLGERFLVVALLLMILHARCPDWIINSWLTLSVAAGVVTVVSLFTLSQSVSSYAVARSADTSGLENYVDDIYKNSRHNYFNHRLFIYANLGQYLLEPGQFESLPLIDHQSSIVKIRNSDATK